MQNKRSVIVLQTTEGEVCECAKALQAEFDVVGCFCDGLSGAKAIERVKPDFLITSLVLKGQDGFAVLYGVKNASPKTKSIVLSEFADGDMIMRAVEAGASYYMLRPVNYEMLIERMRSLLTEPQPPKSGALFADAVEEDSGVYARAIDSFNENDASFNGDFLKSNERAEFKRAKGEAKDSIAAEERRLERGKDEARVIDERLSQIFISIGMPPNIKGYAYLREAVKSSVKTPELINSVTKRLYPSVAIKFGTSASKVERAIRHAIEVAWNKGRVEVLNSLFGVRAYGESEKPTNSEFIALIADRLLLDGFN